MEINIRENIREYIIKHIRQSTLDDNQDLFSSGLLNSLFAMQLVMFVEKEFKLKVENVDLDIKNFRTVNAITNLVQMKLAN